MPLITRLQGEPLLLQVLLGEIAIILYMMAHRGGRGPAGAVASQPGSGRQGGGKKGQGGGGGGHSVRTPPAPAGQEKVKVPEGHSGRPPPDPAGREEVKVSDFLKRKDLVDFLKKRGYKSKGFTGGHEQFYNDQWKHSVSVPKSCEGKKGLISVILDDVFGLSSGGQK